MSYKVVLTDTAKQDLREIAFYIAEKSKDKNTAKNFVNELRKKTKTLEDFPNIGSLPKDYVLKSMGYRYLTDKRYLLFYLVNEHQKTVYVMAIFNEKKDYLRMMKRFI